MNMEAPGQGNNQGQLPARGRGGRRRARGARVDVPGQRGGNITMCTAISENGVVTHIPSLGPYNTQKLLVFLDRLHSDLIPLHERGLVGPHLPTFVIVWDNVSFHVARSSGRGSLPIQEC